MIFPLGLGQWPKHIPYALIIIVLMNVFYSESKFKEIKKYESSVEKQSHMDEFIILRKRVIYEDCLTQKRTFNCELLTESSTRKIYKSLTTLKQKLEFEKYIEPFLLPIDKWPLRAKQNGLFMSLTNLFHEQQNTQLTLGKQFGFLTKNNISLQTLLSANFSHANHFHLMGNLFMLIVFGLHLEMAVGSLLFTMIFLVGGYGGLLIEALQMKQNHILLGASAGVAAIIGCYVVLFWKARMRFLFTITGFSYKSIYLPIAWTVPIFYLANDFTEVFLGNKELSSVAHLAHLTGLFIGVGISILQMKLIPLSWPFLFEQEEKLYSFALTESQPQIQLNYLLEVFDYNYQNNLACLQALRCFSEHDLTIDNAHYTQLHNWGRDILTHAYRTNDLNTVIEILNLTNNKIDSALLLADLSPTSLIECADLCLKKVNFLVH